MHPTQFDETIPGRVSSLDAFVFKIMFVVYVGVNLPTIILNSFPKAWINVIRNVGCNLALSGEKDLKSEKTTKKENIFQPDQFVLSTIYSSNLAFRLSTCNIIISEKQKN